jgi:lambda repressor-like predicted transcriptional regulator
MAPIYTCNRCGKSYSETELISKMFCTCGAFLNTKTCSLQLPQNNCTKDNDKNLLAIFRTKHLPKEHKKNLIEAHQIGSQIISEAREKPEPLETALLVEEYRWFWKPEKVKFVLIAESHVYANAKEIGVKIIPRKLRSYTSSYPEGGPLNYAKIVYCPGYGTPEILDHPELIESNPGTWQFIDLFRKCLGYESPITRSLEWKTKILNAIKKRGIWLLDASCHACAKGKKERLPPDVVKRVVPISWRKYVKPIVDELSINPKQVWFIGKGVRDLVGSKFSDNWIYQPNVRFKDPDKYTEKDHREASLQDVLKAIK